MDVKYTTACCLFGRTSMCSHKLQRVFVEDFICEVAVGPWALLHLRLYAIPSFHVVIVAEVVDAIDHLVRRFHHASGHLFLSLRNIAINHVRGQSSSRSAVKHPSTSPCSKRYAVCATRSSFAGAFPKRQKYEILVYICTRSHISRKNSLLVSLSTSCCHPLLPNSPELLGMPIHPSCNIERYAPRILLSVQHPQHSHAWTAKTSHLRVSLETEPRLHNEYQLNVLFLFTFAMRRWSALDGGGRKGTRWKWDFDDTKFCWSGVPSSHHKQVASLAFRVGWAATVAALGSASLAKNRLASLLK